MTLEQLRIFAAVAESQHVTKAAEKLHLTQAAASAAVAALEQAHGVKLFDRIGRNIQLTSAGRLFLPEARAVLAQAEKARAALAASSGLARGELKLHASQTISGYFLPPRIAAFRAKYPGIQVQLTIGNTGQVAEGVRGAQAELGFVEGPVPQAGFQVAAVAEERMGVFVPAGHDWAGGRLLDAAALRFMPWVFREEGSGTRDFFVAALAEMGIALAELNIALVLPSNEAVREAVAAGAGAACLSPLVCGPSCRAGVLAQANLVLPPRKFHALWHRQMGLSRAAEAFLAMV